jgi:hypothetical protein
LGVVREVLFTGANEVYVVESHDQPPRELLLPAIADVIKRVDLEANLLTVSLLPGLLGEAEEVHEADGNSDVNNSVDVNYAVTDRPDEESPEA